MSKKIINYITNLRHVYRNDADIKKNKKVFDELTSLYLDRKLENKKTLETAIFNLRYGKVDKAEQVMYKYQNALTKKGVIKGSKEKEFHLTAEIARTIQYKNKKYDANGNKELYQKAYKEEDATNVTKNRKLVYSLNIKAQSLQQAEQIYMEMLNADFNDDSYSYVATIDKVTFTSELDVKKLTPTKTQFMYLKAASQVNYDFFTRRDRIFKIY